jgi:hypothetical protein
MEGSTLKASAKLSNVAMPNDLSKPFAIRHGGAGYLLKRQKITEPMRVVINATTQNDKGSYHVELFVPPVFPIPARPCVETNMDGQCVRCSWDKFEVRGGPNSEGTLVCPNMASASDVILAMDATSLLQEDWDGPAPGDPWFAHYILTGPTKTYNQIGAIVHGGCSEVLNFGEKTFLLGEVKAGSAAAATFKTAQCQGCSSAGNAYSCVARYTGLKMFIK